MNNPVPRCIAQALDFAKVLSGIDEIRLAIGTHRALRDETDLASEKRKDELIKRIRELKPMLLALIPERLYRALLVYGFSGPPADELIEHFTA